MQPSASSSSCSCCENSSAARDVDPPATYSVVLDVIYFVIFIVELHDLLAQNLESARVIDFSSVLELSENVFKLRPPLLHPDIHDYAHD